MSVTAIENEVLLLPVAERLHLIDVLWQSLAKPDTAALKVLPDISQKEPKQ